jgi:hypothetical protein
MDQSDQGARTEETKLVDEMAQLKEQVAEQNSLTRMFIRGIVYGIGFVIGSAVIATIIIGLLGPFLADVPWVRDTFRAGEDILPGSR